MSIRKHKTSPVQADPSVAWARRRETLRGALKMMRVLLNAVQIQASGVRERHCVDPTQLWALWELARAPGMRAVELARNLAIHRQRAESLLGELADKGLVRVVAGQEQLAPGHVLTEKGQQIAESVQSDGQGVMMVAMEHLSDAELDQVVHALQLLVEHLPLKDERAALVPLADLLCLSARRVAESPARLCKFARKER